MKLLGGALRADEKIIKQVVAVKEIHEKILLRNPQTSGKTDKKIQEDIRLEPLEIQIKKPSKVN